MRLEELRKSFRGYREDDVFRYLTELENNYTRRLSEQEASPLSALTGGIHLHTLSCPDDGCFARICTVLREKGILIAPGDE